MVRLGEAWTGPEGDLTMPTDDKLQRILAREDECVPSSGFLAAVMDRVEQEAAAPAPIPFPWKRAIPGMVLAAGVFGWGAVELASRALPAASQVKLAGIHLQVAANAVPAQTVWLAVAAAVTLGSLGLARIVTRWS